MKQQCKQCFGALSVPSRIKIMELVMASAKELTVSDVVKKLSLRQPTITFHINKLVKAGILSKRKNGREAYLKFNLDSSHCRACPIFN